MSAAPHVVDVAGVEKRFGTVRALAGVSLHVRPGEMYGVIGPDGAGKTTLLRLICGLIRPDGGRVLLDGVDPFVDHRRAAERIGYVSQRFSLYGDLSIDENLKFFAEIHGVRDFEARRARLLDLTRLTPFRARLADRLSGGMKQKLALACTLIHQPPLLVLDEPTTGVDPVSRREFWKLLADFLASGLTIVMATPYLDEAERCGRVALLDEGRVLAEDTPDRLRADMSGVLLEVVASAARRALDALRITHGREVQLFGDRLHVRVAREDEAAAIRADLARQGLDVSSIRRVRPTLEDVFIDRLADARERAARAAGEAVTS